MNELARQYWNENKVQVHASTENIYFERYFSEINEYLNLNKEDHVFSIGCGEGSLDKYVRANVKVVTGCDFSNELVRQANKKIIDANFFVHDFHQPFPIGDCSYNKVYSFSVMQYASPAEIKDVILNSINIIDSGLIGHFDIPDKNKIIKYFISQGSRFKLVGLLRYIKYRFFNKESFLWDDGSYAHDVDSIINELRSIGYDVTKVDSKCYYRTNILIKR